MLSGSSYTEVAAVAGKIGACAGKNTIHHSTKPRRRLLSRLSAETEVGKVPLDGWTKFRNSTCWPPSGITKQTLLAGIGSSFHEREAIPL